MPRCETAEKAEWHTPKLGYFRNLSQMRLFVQFAAVFVKVDWVMRSPFAATSTRGITRHGVRDKLLSADEKMAKSADQAAHTQVLISLILVFRVNARCRHVYTWYNTLITRVSVQRYRNLCMTDYSPPAINHFDGCKIKCISNKL